MKKVKLSDGREITLKTLTVRMMRTALKKETEIDQTISMVSQTTGIDEAELDELPVSDFIVLQKELESFLSVAGVASPKMK